MSPMETLRCFLHRRGSVLRLMSSCNLNHQTLVLLLLRLLLLASTVITPSSSTSTNGEATDPKLQSYIVHVRPPPPEHNGTEREWHESFLPHPSRLLHSYTHVLSGFTAALTPDELESLKRLEGFVHATPARTRRLHTTHSPSFLGLNTDKNGFWARSARYVEGVIIGVLDTGITPSHPSFSGAGMPPPPANWTGSCRFRNVSLCSNKLIGAKSFKGVAESSLEPLDEDGHGTHTASTAAGQFVRNASLLGSASGTAAGVAPFAHLAAYKVCWKNVCHESSVAMDVAVREGVHVISMSIGDDAVPLYNDTDAVASFSAVKRGVFVAMSAGNEGPSSSTVHNISPWVLTVGAGTLDRRIRATVKLGKGSEFQGESAYQPSNFSGYFPLVYPLLVHPPFVADATSTYCTNATTLKEIGVAGKIVLCRGYVTNDDEKSVVVKEAGGAAMVVWGAEQEGYRTDASANVLPTSHVSYADGLAIFEYIGANADAKATIEFHGTTIGGAGDPAVAAFSSRGPSRINGGILKPDIIGPGVNILAAWPEPVGPFPLYPPFNMISGTSMACPHLAGVAALLKASHPDWSPAMIKSAIMTTADVTNRGGRPLIDTYDKTRAPFYATGAGQVNPVKANDPGLVYDIQWQDYIPYLCGLGYTDDQVRVITSDHTIACANFTPIDEPDLNYPSVTVFLTDTNGNFSSVGRTLTNVGCANSSYSVYVERPFGITVDVVPATLDFATLGAKRSFRMEFSLNGSEPSGVPRPWISQGYLAWRSSDCLVQVRSPLLVRVE